jgi:hypothetical protein
MQYLSILFDTYDFDVQYPVGGMPTIQKSSVSRQSQSKLVLSKI